MRLPISVRTTIFTYLQDDIISATEFAIFFPVCADEIGSTVFTTYRATAPRSLYLLLCALIQTPAFFPHVTSIHLPSSFDDPDHSKSGFWQFLLTVGNMDLPVGHFASNIQAISEGFIECEEMKCEVVDGEL